MRARFNRKLMTGGLALSLILGGAIYAYADESGTPAAGGQTQSAPAQAPKVEYGKHDRMGMGMEKAAGASFQQLADILGMKPEEIKTALKDGKSIADLAQAKGISEKDLIDKLTANATRRIDDAVKAGKLTQERADKIKENMPDRFKKFVERKGLPKFEHGMNGHRMMGMNFDMKKIAALIGIGEDELKTELKSGKSLADIAAAHGVSKDQLVSKLKDDMTPMIEKFVTRSHKEGDMLKHKPGQAPAPDAAPSDGTASN